MEPETTLREMGPGDLERVVELITVSAYPEYGLRAKRPSPSTSPGWSMKITVSWSYFAS